MHGKRRVASHMSVERALGEFVALLDQGIEQHESSEVDAVL